MSHYITQLLLMTRKLMGATSTSVIHARSSNKPPQHKYCEQENESTLLYAHLLLSSRSYLAVSKVKIVE